MGNSMTVRIEEMNRPKKKKKGKYTKVALLRSSRLTTRAHGMIDCMNILRTSRQK